MSHYLASQASFTAYPGFRLVPLPAPSLSASYSFVGKEGETAAYLVKLAPQVGHHVDHHVAAVDDHPVVALLPLN